MATLNLRRFSSLDALRRIKPVNLFTFLDPYREYFEGRGLRWPEEPSEASVDYPMLAQILMSPDHATPPDLVDALYYVNDMGTNDGMELLMEAAEQAGLPVVSGDHVTPVDYAIQVWLLSRELVEEKHEQLYRVRLRSFEYFMTLESPVPAFKNPTETTLRALEDDMNAWFVKRRRGSTCKVQVFENENIIWFMVRHGDPFTREPVIQENESSSILYQPEKHDVIVYNPRLGEIRINAGNKGEKELYRTRFGLHLFGSKDFFSSRSRFDLEPLRQSGEDTLRCEDVAGMEWAKLKEIEISWGGAFHASDIKKADDLFAMLRERNRRMPTGGKLNKAKFQIKFSDSKEPRTVGVTSGNRSQFKRDDDALIIESWLGKRGFIVGFKEEDDT